MRRALQLIFAMAFIGLVVAAVTTTREVLGAASPAFAWPSPRGTVLGYPAGFVDLLLYGVIAAAALTGLVAGYRGRAAARQPRARYAPPFHPRAHSKALSRGAWSAKA